MRQVLEAGRRREPKAVAWDELQRFVDELPELARGLEARVPRVDDAEDDGLPLEDVDPPERRRLARADVDADLRDGERRKRLEDPIGWEEVRLHGDRDARRGDAPYASRAS